MRVTQSMLSTNMLRNLSNSYSRMGTLQDQLNTGKKITRPSQDPVVAIKGIGYRTDLTKVEQYQRNLGEASNWLDTTDSTLDGVGQAIHRVKELTIDAANETKTDSDREAIAQEIAQIQKQIQDMANAKVGDKYVFSGTNTTDPLYNPNGAPPLYDANGFLNSAGVDKPVNIAINDGVELQVNSEGKKIFGDIETLMTQLHTALVTPGGGDLNTLLGVIDDSLGQVLEARADVGARQNRVEMMNNRLETQNVVVTKQLSDNEDIDYAQAITDLITQESIHRAGLSIGGRIIQPSLVDFLR